MDNEELIDISNRAKEFSYSPYSNFRVGAALLSKSGKYYTGTNVENSSYGLTNCAERTAVFKAISEGEKEFSKIVLTSDADDFITPCGACRQVMMEICGPDLEVIMCNANNETKVVKLKELLPYSFNKEYLDK